MTAPTYFKITGLIKKDKPSKRWGEAQYSHKSRVGYSTLTMTTWGTLKTQRGEPHPIFTY